MSRDDETLRDLLRRNDPASGGEGLGPVERARMRQAVAEAARGAAARPLLPRPVVVGALAAAAIAAVGLGVLIDRMAPRQGTSPERGGTGVAAGSSGDPARIVRQVQIATPGGTRVVWILNSDFKL